MPNITFYRGRKQATAKNFSFLTWIWFCGIRASSSCKPSQNVPDVCAHNACTITCLHDRDCTCSLCRIVYLLITLLSYYLCYFVVSATHNLRNFVTSVTPLLCYPLILCLFCSFVTPVTELPVTGLISLIWKKYYKLMEVLYTFPMIFKVKPIFNPI